MARRLESAHHLGTGTQSHSQPAPRWGALGSGGKRERQSLGSLLPQLPRPYSRSDSKRNILTQVSQVHTLDRHTPRHIHGYAESLRTHTPGSTYKDTHTCKRTQELKHTHRLLNTCPHVHNHSLSTPTGCTYMQSA